MIKALKLSPKGETKDFLSILFKLSLPVIFQNVLHSFVNLVDTIMVESLGDVAIGAVGLGNQIYFIIHLIIFGVASGVSVFIAQYWGSQDIKGIHKSMGIGISILLPVTLAAMLFVIAKPQTVLSLFTSQPELLEEGAKYLRVVSASYVFSGITMILGQSLRSTENVRTPFFSTAMSLILNVVLNYILIYGKLGFPAMGIIGAGLATSISRIIETIILLAIIYTKGSPAALKIKTAFSFSGDFIKRFIKTSSFVIITETLWGFGTTLFFAAYGRVAGGIETEVVAAVNVSKTIENLVLVFYWGFAAASAVTVGKLIGQQTFDKARRYAYRFIITGLITGLVLGIALYFISFPILSLFKDISQSAKDYARLYISLFSVFLFLRGSCAITTVGVLRSGGDTVVAMLIDVVPLYVIILPAMFYATIVLKAAPVYLFLIAMSYDLLRFVPSMARILGDKWMKNVVD
ncbi:MAG: MATE family efflux transporter [Clostridia bacterium]|nr:MATE family efflux transporter [Clostridia bacterium]